MARPKHVHPLLAVARAAVDLRDPVLQHALVRLQQLDGPPGSPRYAAVCETCPVERCPHGVALEVAAAGQCHIRECTLRHSLRLLLDREGNVLHETHSDLHWR